MYDDGTEISKDRAESQKWRQKAAQQSNPTAEWNLAVIYGSGTGAQSNAAESLKWMKLATQHGNATAQKFFAVEVSVGERPAKVDDRSSTSAYKRLPL